MSKIVVAAAIEAAVEAVVVVGVIKLVVVVVGVVAVVIVRSQDKNNEYKSTGFKSTHTLRRTGDGTRNTYGTTWTWSLYCNGM